MKKQTPTKKAVAVKKAMPAKAAPKKVAAPKVVAKKSAPKKEKAHLPISKKVEIIVHPHGNEFLVTEKGLEEHAGTFKTYISPTNPLEEKNK
jgi:hypothetical protein